MMSNMNMVSVSAALCKPVAMTSFNPALTMDLFRQHLNKKEKVVVIMGATGTGKSKLAIDLATQFPPAEIINSDKMQVYEGLDITTNKVTKEECRGVPHHLLATVNNNSITNFSAKDFCEHASLAIGSILGRDALPIIAGGSNSYLDALVNHQAEFRLRYECCFLWVDVSLPVLHSSLSARVDRMIHAGQVDEVRKTFEYHNEDYSRGVRRAIGVPEFHHFFKAEADGADDTTKLRLLHEAIAAIKVNNCNLANRQLQKIHHLYNIWKRNMHRLDATDVFLKNTPQEAHDAWETHVLSKSRRILHKFLYDDSLVDVPAGISSVIASSSSPPMASAATH